MNTSFTADFVIAVHDLSRPIERAVRSILNESSSSRIGVIVVAHGIDAHKVEERLAPDNGLRLRVVPFADGIPSPAGPFNYGISISTADYVGVVGSDDYLEGGAAEAWLAHLDEHSPDALIAPLRHQGGEPILSPLTRRGRSLSLDAVRDRLFYRSAPLGLVRSEVLKSEGLTFTHGFSSGEDLRMSAALWANHRIDYRAELPAYVVGADAATRVTTAPVAASIALDPVVDLLRSPLVRAFDGALRRSLAIKVLRIHVLGALLGRPNIEDWGREQRDSMQAVISLLLEGAPAALAPLSAADQALVRSVCRSDSAEEWVRAIARRRAGGRLAVAVPRNPFRAFDRESDVVRFARYRLDA